MSGPDKPRRRPLRDDERTLWRGVTRSVAPLKRRPVLVLEEAAKEKAAERKTKAIVAKKRVPPAAMRNVPGTKSPLAAKSPPLPLVPLERRLKQRLARGTEEIFARLDLHGRTQMEAHSVLLRFLQRAQADGEKIVLVITGKGGRNDAPNESGVLKRQVPLWLTLPEFRAYVMAVEEAHLGHGGRGALYVRVRRARA